MIVVKALLVCLVLCSAHKGHDVPSLQNMKASDAAPTDIPVPQYSSQPIRERFDHTKGSHSFRSARRFFRPHKLLDVAVKSCNLAPVTEVSANKSDKLQPTTTAKEHFPPLAEVTDRRNKTGLVGGSEHLSMNETEPMNSKDIPIDEEPVDDSDVHHVENDTPATNTIASYIEAVRPYVEKLNKYAYDTYEYKQQQNNKIKVRKAPAVEPITRNRSWDMFVRTKKPTTLTSHNPDIQNSTETYISEQHNLAKEYIQQLEQQVHALESVVRSKDTSVQELTTRLAELELQCSALQSLGKPCAPEDSDPILSHADDIECAAQLSLNTNTTDTLQRTITTTDMQQILRSVLDLVVWMAANYTPVALDHTNISPVPALPTSHTLIRVPAAERANDTGKHIGTVYADLVKEAVAERLACELEQQRLRDAVCLACSVLYNPLHVRNDNIVALLAQLKTACEEKCTLQTELGKASAQLCYLRGQFYRAQSNTTQELVTRTGWWRWWF